MIRSFYAPEEFMWSASHHRRLYAGPRNEVRGRALILGVAMQTFHQLLDSVCLRPGMYVAHDESFHEAAALLRGYDFALCEFRPDLRDTGLTGFQEWLVFRLDSCPRSGWEEVVVREETGENKFDALRSLYAEFARYRSENGVDSLLARYERFTVPTIAEGIRTCRLDPRVFVVPLSSEITKGIMCRLCFCGMPFEERNNWRPNTLISLESYLGDILSRSCCSRDSRSSH